MIIIIMHMLSNEESAIIDQIFSQHHITLYNISLKILNSHQDAEDAVGQTFMKLINNIEKIKEMPSSKMLPFCIIVLKNTSIDIYRKNSGTISIELIEDMPDLFSDAAEEAFFKEHDRDFLQETINKLPDEDRYLLELRWGEDMPYKDIGTVMNITEPAARKRVQRALERLQKIYLEEGCVNA